MGIRLLAMTVGLTVAMGLAFPHRAAADAMTEYFQYYENASAPPAAGPQADREEDAITAYIRYYLPFTDTEEKVAVTDTAKGRTLGAQLWEMVDPFSSDIRQASSLFNVPESVIAAIIAIESSGKPDSKNPHSSAKGLMQTIDATFASCRADLANQGISIHDPLTGRDSIMAGSFYLSRMFDHARKMHPESVSDRADITHWTWPMRYYFAGPGYEAKIKHHPSYSERRITYSNNVSIALDDPMKYSNKGQRFARFLESSRKG